MKLLKQGAVYCFLCKIRGVKQSWWRGLCFLQAEFLRGQSCCTRPPPLASAKGSLVTAWCQAILRSRIPLLGIFFHHINLTTLLIVPFNYLFICVSFCSTCCLQVGCESNMTKNGSKNGKRSCLLPMAHYQEQWGLSSFAFGSLLFRNNLRVLKEDFDIYCLVLAGLDKGDKVACDKARKLFVIYCATTVSESVFVCLKCIS